VVGVGDRREGGERRGSSRGNKLTGRKPGWRGCLSQQFPGTWSVLSVSQKGWRPWAWIYLPYWPLLRAPSLPQNLRAVLDCGLCRIQRILWAESTEVPTYSLMWDPVGRWRSFPEPPFTVVVGYDLAWDWLQLLCSFYCHTTFLWTQVWVEGDGDVERACGG
jgi:hypothetical protein